VAVVALDDEGEPEAVRARIPTAWYPTSVTASADGRSLFVTNAKGAGAGSNDKPVAPDPTRRNPPVVDGITGYSDGYCNCLFDTYTGSMIVGTLSTIELPRAGLLAVYTDQVRRNNRYPGGPGARDDAGGRDGSADPPGDDPGGAPPPGPGPGGPPPRRPRGY